MGLLDRLMFWRRNDEQTTLIDPVDGYTVDGCFTLPTETPSSETPASETPSNNDGSSSDPSAECEQPRQGLPVDETEVLDGSGHGDVEVP